MIHSSPVWSTRTGLFCPSVCFAFALHLGSTDFRFFPQLRALVGIGTSTKEQSIEPDPVRQTFLVAQLCQCPRGGASRLLYIRILPRLIDVDACCAFIS